MAVDYLSEEQKARYARFAGEPSVQELEEFFRLDAVALEQARAKRQAHNRLGWAVQWGTVRMLGTFLSAPADVPTGVAEFVAEQLEIDDPSCLKLYPERLPTQHEHAREIRRLLKIRDFDDGDLQLREYIAGRVWVSNEGPRALFDRAVTWLLRNRVLLPGITPLAYLVAEVRTGEQALIYSVADAPVTPEFRRELLELLDVPKGAFRSSLERRRKGPVDVSGQGQKQALERSRDIREVKAGEVDVWRVPPVKMAELARYGMNAHAPTLRCLAEPRRTATVLATMRHLESAAVDDALTLFDVLMATKLLARAERADVKEQMKGLPRLRKAAAKVKAAAAAFLDVPIERLTGGDEESEAERGAVAMAEGWAIVEQIVTREELVKAVVELGELLPEGAGKDADTAWRKQLIDRYATARRFTSLLAEVIPWGATKAGAPVVEALRELPKVQARRKPGVEHIDTTLLDGAWKRLVLGNPELAPNGIIDSKAWTFCVLENLHTALKRRDVYAKGADTWGDPRGRLLSGADWQVNRPRVLTALELSGSAGGHLGELEVLLDEMYAHVADNLPGNAAVDIVDGKIRLDRLEAEEEPAGYKMVHDAVQAMLPKVDYPELLLEVHARTGMFDCFEHIGGKAVRADDLDLTLTALLVHKSTNIGMEPVVKPGEKALPRSRLAAADSGYFNPANMGRASGLLVARQGDIDLVGDWGGGHVASADGMRFTVPARSIHTRPNRKYIAAGRGATWLNVVSDRVMGLGGIVMPGTLRDSLGILDAMFNLDSPVRPEIVITDTGSYSDLVFGLFAICGYQFSPRIADISDARLRRFDMGKDYGPLQSVSRQRAQVERIAQNWEDMLRVVGSLQTGKVRAYDLLRMMTSGDRMTGLSDAFAHCGHIFKTLHLLQFIDSEAYRRMIGVQLNIGEGRHALGRRIFFGRLGELRHGYETGWKISWGHWVWRSTQ
ncbi:transposase [Streptomyces spectabilis]|uniref:TnpA family transposase n=1 Tax=Streptomyces spectabilis TaxID=68270 RepID=A0A7W8B3B0_STRST|nr:Tn3 family transposase [Streptomyces spectabilis]MBB5109584.1 TnpA family transposase [Streptomyces spectabilis]GGV57568.1 transposase [Streptomyces spectabilis]